MVSGEDIDYRMASLEIDEEENEAFVLDGDVDEKANKYELCLVGRLLTEKSINVRAMKSKLADVWRPAMGLSIKDLDQGCFLFQFYRKEDMQWVLKGGPWSFDNAMVALETVEAGQNPASIKPCFLSIWIQLYNLPVGYMLETVGKQLGNFFGVFLEYDVKNSTSIWRECMRVRIKLDVRKPIKRKKKIVKKDGQEFTVECKYERLGEFCFTCGLVSHTDRFCRNAMEKGVEVVTKEWGSWLRAPPRRVAGQVQSKWLRDEGDDTWEARIGRENFAGEVFSNKGKEIMKVSDHRVGSATNVREGSKQIDINGANFKGYLTTSNILYELNEEDGEDIQLEDRKRRRGVTDGLGHMEIDSGQQLNIVQAIQNQEEAAISNGDLSVSNQTSPAELAKQASHHQ
ncbi:uncharacterized protein LOC141696272 [Apium graveolens]|uniref:uncharacterized protein LOC141665166 n=1 Tax=Apium graveolens TaxID=4045 RepID=UPI003D79AE22